MASIDLAVLGAEPGRYRAYAEAIRREYGHLSDAAYREGRSALLLALLAREAIFPDAGFRARYEARARKNIERELERLGRD